MEEFFEDMNAIFNEIADGGPNVNSIESLSLAAAVINRLVQIKKSNANPLEVEALYVVLVQLTMTSLARDKLRIESLLDPNVMDRVDNLMNTIK